MATVTMWADGAMVGSSFLLEGEVEREGLKLSIRSSSVGAPRGGEKFCRNV